MKLLYYWFLAFRPKTLSAALSPVMIATSMAMERGVAHLPTALLCLVVALLLQIGTNIANDYYDYLKGADDAARTGPTRVTQAGLLAPATVRRGFILCFALAALGCVLLVMRAGWPIAVLGVLAILAGLFYTAGPRPLGYLGLGDVVVLVFFGPVAVAGCYYTQALEIDLIVVLAGVAPGLLAMAILTVNNLRDIDGDRRAGKKTLAVRFGASFARLEYSLAVLGAALMPPLLLYLAPGHGGILLASLLCLGAIPLMRVVWSYQEGPVLNRTLGQTGALLLGYCLIFSVGWWWG